MARTAATAEESFFLFARAFCAMYSALAAPRVHTHFPPKLTLTEHSRGRYRRGAAL
jgi:hypothetical protein